MSSPAPSQPILRVFAEAGAASLALAEESGRAIRAAGSRGFVLGLPTGNTPLALYRCWIGLHRQGRLSFAAVRAFHLDEYWPAPAGASFGDFLREHLFRHVDLPQPGVELLDGRVPEAGILAECARYEARIAAAGGIGLQVLGLGANGHVAFNEPGSAPDSRTRRVRLAEETIARAAESRPEWGRCREALTLGLGTVLEARALAVLAFGAAKAEAVASALDGPESTDCPASFLRRHPRATWWLDSAAASRLSRSFRVE